MRRLLRGLLLLVGAAFLVLGAAFAYAQTPLGRGQIGDLLGSSLSAEGRTVEVEGIQGLIPFSVRIGRVRLADDEGVWLEVDNARVGLRPLELLAGRVRLDEVGAERVRVERAPELPSAAP
jgi:translocation and assembly module TamB